MSESAVETEALPRTRLARTFSALRYREFRLVWIGAFTSTTGTWMQTVAQAWVVYSLAARRCCSDSMPSSAPGRC